MRTTVDIVDLDDEGLGRAEHEGRALLVAGALPGDRVRVEVEHTSPHGNKSWGRLLALELASPDRVQPVCPATGRCGGCPLGALAYPAQLAWKEARVARLVGPSLPMFASPRPVGYRNHAKLVFGRTGGRARDRLALGGYAPRSHELVDLAGCRVVEPVLEEVRAALLDALLARNVDPMIVPHVVLRSNHAREVLVTLVGRVPDELEALREAHPAIVGVCANDGPRGNAIFGAITRTLWGRGELDERIGDVTLHVSPTAFFQINREVAAALYAAIDAWIPAGARVADVYSGIGGIALTLAHGREVVGVEVNEAAVADATRAARGRARFIADDAARGLTTLGRVDAVVINPPRKGVERSVIDAIRAASPERIAYVSCNPVSLARDLALLPGYVVESTRAYDMHPQTAHVETLALLRADKVIDGQSPSTFTRRG
ncbi:MAG: 23S rRNA (uracil(1939)-C(5))-methyltransferase RlmD [Polyangia bacterium]